MGTNYLIWGGGAVLLLIGIMVVFLEAAYDAGFEEGFTRGRAATRKEVR